MVKNIGLRNETRITSINLYISLFSYQSNNIQIKSYRSVKNISTRNVYLISMCKHIQSEQLSDKLFIYNLCMFSIICIKVTMASFEERK